MLLEKGNETIYETGPQGPFSPKENKTGILTSEGDLGHVGLDLLN